MAEKMKDSGITWIGEIPEEWYKNKASRLFGIIGSGTTPNTNDIDLNEGQVPWIQSGDLNGDTLTDVGNTVSKAVVDKYTALKIYEAPFIVIAMYGASIGKISFSSINGCVNQACCVLADSQLNLRYSFYMLKSAKEYLLQNAVGGGQPNISQEIIRQSWLLIPPVIEQHAIAAYLDRKCGQIDDIIADLQRQIECLESYKKSLISETVTKGLNPDVPMKDSGIEWIGQMPEHWAIRKIKFVAQTSSGSTPSRNMDHEYFEGADIRWVRTMDLNDGKVYDSSEKITKQALRESSCAIMPVGTVCVAMYGGAGTIGKCGILMKESSTNQAVCSMVCDEGEVCSEYMLYQMIFLRKHWMKYAMGGRKDPNIRQEIVKNMSITVAPIDEQRNIVCYLDRKCAEIDTILDDKRRQVENMKNHRKSVIYEYVTGKKRVKEV